MNSRRKNNILHQYQVIYPELKNESRGFGSHNPDLGANNDLTYPDKKPTHLHGRRSLRCHGAWAHQDLRSDQVATARHHQGWHADFDLGAFPARYARNSLQ
jgi:hypothetical protein